MARFASFIFLGGGRSFSTLLIEEIGGSRGVGTGRWYGRLPRALPEERGQSRSCPGRDRRPAAAGLRQRCCSPAPASPAPLLGIAGKRRRRSWVPKGITFSIIQRWVCITERGRRWWGKLKRFVSLVSLPRDAAGGVRAQMLKIFNSCVVFFWA